MCFSLKDHFDPLKVVIAFFFYDDFAITLVNNCNNEVHKNHEKEELANHKDGKSDHYHLVRVNVFAILHDVKRIVGVDQGKVTHCCSQSGQELSRYFWHSTITFSVYLQNMEAFSKREKENSEEHEEVFHVHNHLLYHHDQERKLLKAPNELEEFE